MRRPVEDYVSRIKHLETRIRALESTRAVSTFNNNQIFEKYKVFFRALTAIAEGKASTTRACINKAKKALRG